VAPKSIARTSAIALKDIQKTYKSKGGAATKALAGIDLSVEYGEFVAIMGRSGSGKSSLMHVIGLLDQHFTGDYELDGNNVRRLSSGKLTELRSSKIGFVFQQFSLLQRSNVLQNVLLPTVYSPAKDDQMRALNLIERVGLVPFIEHKSNQLSGGQMQRVAIARALIMNPTILLADEPTGNLDTATAHEIMELFKDINKQGTTVIVITHEDDIAAYADRVVHMNDGRIQKEARR
jgi:putative ABC transport system ATP-binding protein